jgi:hypothetical protein
MQTIYCNWSDAVEPRKGTRDIDEQKSNQDKIKIRTLKPYRAAPPAVMIGDFQSRGNFPSVPQFPQFLRIYIYNDNGEILHEAGCYREQLKRIHELEEQRPGRAQDERRKT